MQNRKRAGHLGKVREASSAKGSFGLALVGSFSS